MFFYYLTESWSYKLLCKHPSKVWLFAESPSAQKAMLKSQKALDEPTRDCVELRQTLRQLKPTQKHACIRRSTNMTTCSHISLRHRQWLVDKSDVQANFTLKSCTQFASSFKYLRLQALYVFGGLKSVRAINTKKKPLVVLEVCFLAENDAPSERHSKEKFHFSWSFTEEEWVFREELVKNIFFAPMCLKRFECVWRVFDVFEERLMCLKSVWCVWCVWRAFDVFEEVWVCLKSVWCVWRAFDVFEECLMCLMCLMCLKSGGCVWRRALCVWCVWRALILMCLAAFQVWKHLIVGKACECVWRGTWFVFEVDCKNHWKFGLEHKPCKTRSRCSLTKASKIAWDWAIFGKTAGSTLGFCSESVLESPFWSSSLNIESTEVRSSSTFWSSFFTDFPFGFWSLFPFLGFKTGFFFGA